MAYTELIQFLMEAMYHESMKPYIKIVYGIDCFGFLQEEPFLAIIQEISDTFYSRIHSAIKVEIESERNSPVCKRPSTIERHFFRWD